MGSIEKIMCSSFTSKYQMGDTYPGERTWKVKDLNPQA